MNLTLYSHPLASFCHKVLIALYENGTPFTHEIVNLGDAEASAGFRALWPMGKMPVLRDEGRGRTLPETTIILEYLDTHYPGAQPLLPKDQDRRLEARLWDRVFDSYVQVPMQKIVADVRRAPNDRDPCGVADAHATLKLAYDMLERQVAQRTWAVGEAFSIADCAAAPALFYAGVVAPFSASHPNVTAYFDRLVDRPSFRRVIDEARPYFQYFPFKESLPARFL
ncbi:MAG: glutathione S-transferase family protein [Gammaproteobacteria bacterium]